jgi:hypothetical protein
MPTQIHMDDSTTDRLGAQAKARKALAEAREQEGLHPKAPPVSGSIHPPRDPARRNAQEIFMPETSTEPRPFNSVKIGEITVFHSDDGGPYGTSREKVSIIDANGARIDDARRAIFILWKELRRLADTARASKK